MDKIIVEVVLVLSGLAFVYIFYLLGSYMSDPYGYGKAEKEKQKKLKKVK